MLQAGKNILNNDDQLRKVDIQYFYNAIKKPKQEIESLIHQLRKIESIDKERYRELKKRLPYVVCGIFNPPYRKSDNFAWIQYFILDIDHISSKSIEIESLKDRLSNDDRIVMVFTSPGCDGIKVMFRLSEKCYDLRKYSIFYKIFAQEFSNKYSLEQVLDTRTSDVTRACFVSFDKTVYLNEDIVSIDIDKYVNFEDVESVDNLEFEFQKKLKEEQDRDVKETTVTAKKDVSKEILEQIKQKLNPKKRIVRDKQIYVPEEIDAILDSVVEKFNYVNIDVVSIKSINYGKKFVVKAKHLNAEVNLFYGKRGFTVVKSPKRGTNPEFNQVAMEVIESVVCE